MALFNGSDYLAHRDDVRLKGQIGRVYGAMIDNTWRTLSDIAEITGDPEASISAQLRHLRKQKFGGFEVDKRHMGNGLYAYRLRVADCEFQDELFLEENHGRRSQGV